MRKPKETAKEKAARYFGSYIAFTVALQSKHPVAIELDGLIRSEVQDKS